MPASFATIPLNRLNVYDVTITNDYTGGETRFTAFDQPEVARRINQHYGIRNHISKSGVLNLLRRGYDRSPQRYRCLRIVQKKIPRADHHHKMAPRVTT